MSVDTTDINVGTMKFRIYKKSNNKIWYYLDYYIGKTIFADDDWTFVTITLTKWGAKRAAKKYALDHRESNKIIEEFRL